MRPGPMAKDKLAGRYLVKKTADMSGEHVTGAHAFFSTQYGVSLSLDSIGTQQFGDLTKASYEQGTPLAILLDGNVICAPVAREPIYGGSAEITGDYTEAQARNLASVLQNPLRTPVHIEEERSVSGTLGRDSINSGIYAGLGGLALVLLFVIAYYQFAGLVAVLGLVINIILLFGIMSMFNFVLTLPGIAGIILTIGLAVDANVLIYERLREEMSAGKPLGSAIEAAYNKAFSVIFDANATTLITAAILFWKSSGPVKGFAVTLTVGIIASVFSAMVVTPHRLWLGHGSRLDQAHHDAAPDQSREADRFHEQAPPLDQHLAHGHRHFHCRLRDARPEEFRHRFPRRRPAHPRFRPAGQRA